jgi:hypothetical protein
VAQVLLFLASLSGLAGVARADNPIIQTIYTADPAPLVYNGRLYLATTHDEDGSTNFNMRDWRLFSSGDVVNWQDHGAVMSLSTFNWALTRGLDILFLAMAGFIFRLQCAATQNPWPSASA